MSVHPKKVFLGTIVEAQFGISRILPFFILNCSYAIFFNGNPILTQIEASVKWGKKNWFPPLRKLKIYSRFVKKNSE